jgi:3-oxoacyl-(acyl-carrier-protein) synthase
MILSEGAGAILLGRTGPVEIEKIAGGTNFRKQREAGAAVEKVFAELGGEADLVVASANGTFVDQAERTAVLRHCPNAKVYAMKEALGESPGASSLWQTICGVQSLRTQLVPRTENEFSAKVKGQKQLRRAVISVCGLNQQVAGLRLARN